jgi:phage shock protein C
MENTTGTATPTAPTAAPADPPRTPAFRLQRSRTDRMLGGVCGGLAESLGVDAALLRIGLVVLTVLGAGIGIVLYLAAWILAPEAELA